MRALPELQLRRVEGGVRLEDKGRDGEQRRCRTSALRLRPPPPAPKATAATTAAAAAAAAAAATPTSRSTVAAATAAFTADNPPTVPPRRDPACLKAKHRRQPRAAHVGHYPRRPPAAAPPAR